MKKVYIISYGFIEKKGDYAKLYDALMKLGPYWHEMDNTWFVQSSLTPKEIMDAIHPYLDDNIYLFISLMTTDYWGWLPKSGWKWIDKYLKSNKTA